MLPALRIAIALTGVPAVAHGQSSPALVSQARDAYQQLDYESAAGLLRRALIHPDSLADASRAEAYGYLAASEHYRGRGAAAREAFRQALWTNPRFRPDTLVFPPEVQNVFALARREAKAVAVSFQPAGQLGSGVRRLTIRVYASSPVPVTVMVEPPAGLVKRVLYEGPVRDSTDVPWDGFDGAGAPPVAGVYLLGVATRARTLSVPLALEPGPTREVALLDPPPAEEMLPERTSFAPALRVAAAGLAIAGLAAVLPAFAGEPSSMNPERFAVSGVAGIVAVAGGLLQRPGRRIPENAAKNAETRARWRQRTDSLHAADELRKLEAPFIVAPGKVSLSPEGEP